MEQVTSGHTVLLVEDETIIALAEMQELQSYGYRVEHVQTADQAIARSNDPDIDLVLMDIDLGPDSMDGTQAAAAILTRRHIPIVFLSSHTEREVVAKTEKVTSYGYVVKNSGITVLDASIRMAFRLFQARERERVREDELSRQNAELQATEEELRQSNEELQAVQNELREYIETLMLANDELRISENRFRSLVETQSNYVIRTDLDAYYTFVNQRFVRDFAHPHEKLVGNYSMESIVPEDHAKVFEAVREVIENPDTAAQIEIRKPRSDGRVIPTLWSFSCITNADGMPAEIQAVGFDITDRAALEQALRNEIAEKETLLKEVHHRIKNSIASISQMLELQAEFLPAPEARHALRETVLRIDSLKSVYDMLLRSDQFEELSSRAYLLSLLESLQAFYDPGQSIEFATSIDDFQLHTKHAYLLGIIINELVTNAFKYAFPEDRGPYAQQQIRVLLTRDTSRENLTTVLVSDTGTGTTEALDSSNTGGLGSLMVRSLAEQLGGRAIMKGTSGTTWTIQFRI